MFNIQLNDLFKKIRYLTVDTGIIYVNFQATKLLTVQLTTLFVLFYISFNILKLFYCIAYLSSNHAIDMNITIIWYVIVYSLQSICQTKNGRPPVATNAWEKLKYNIYFGQLLINHFDWPTTTGNILLLLLSSLFLPLQSIDAFYSKSFRSIFLRAAHRYAAKYIFAPFFVRII